MQTIYRTHDGVEHPNYEEACTHEKQLFNDWLATNPIICVDEVLKTWTLESCRSSRHTSDKRAEFKALLRQYFETTSIVEQA